MATRMNFADRLRLFLAKIEVDPDTGCWMWTASTRGFGYGQFWDDGRLHQAHRWAYERFVGPVPSGLGLDHFHCDRPARVNPCHVRPATQRENVLRSANQAAENLAKTHCPQGHAYDDENTYVWSGNGQRICRKCHAGHERGRRARRRAETCSA